MTREIKFRVWDNTNSEMVYEIESMAFAGNGEPANVDIGFSSPVIANGDDPQVVLMQFTGLMDKNGKEIYEGDLVPCMYKHDGHTDHVYEVIWYEVNAAFRLRRHGNACPQLQVVQEMYDAARNKVIGNIYENPELLK